jgi:hypothetical protein
MPEIDHNAPRFQYRVSWKRDIPGEPWNSEDVSDWERTKLVVPNQPTFQQYRVRVVAINEKGEANVAPKEVIGFSGEDGMFMKHMISNCFLLQLHTQDNHLFVCVFFSVPLQPPRNFSVLTVTDSTSALLSWEPVTVDSVRGEFKGYKVSKNIFCI